MTEDTKRSEEMIFSTALRMSSAAERSSYLDNACGSEGNLRRRIEALLEAQPRLAGFMEDAPAFAPLHPQGTVRPAGSDEGPGSRIGRYKLLETLGEGGCGVVYMAEQEEPVRRRVALKVIKLGMDTRSVIARFEAERQALALMDHPNIAKVLDADATETGRPYFVMELVRGVRITEFCDKTRLSTRERLDLFIQVCHAVQHAHQKGIIHRDLKPSNILVTIENPGSPGVPKIIDFGIAKATQGRLTDLTLFTAFEQFLGTPAYMSPEQTLMTSLDVDTRSDIYSLGVLLYELVTGCTPFNSKDLLAAGLEEMSRTIREKDPPRPSTRLSALHSPDQVTAARYRDTDPPKLINLVRGDLDWIVMKCLEKDRARRYETASALAADLQRHLKDEPVVACPPSRLYEFHKTLRRHKGGVAAAVLITIALAAGLFISSREAVRSRRAEQQTRRIAYVADMDLANRALDENDLGTAQALLRRYWPGPNETDVRNWEWRYLANLSHGDPHFSLVAHSAWIRMVRFLDDNTLLTAASADWLTVLWNLKERRPSNIVTNRNVGGAGGVSDLTVVALRRKMLFSRSQWNRASAITAIDLHTGNESPLHDANRTRLDSAAPITSLDLSPDETALAVAFGNRVAIWDLDQKTWSQPFDTESGAATQGLFSPDGRVLVVADEKGHAAFWNLANRRKYVLTNAPGTLGFLKFSRDGQWLVNPGGNMPTKIWRVEDRTLIAELRDPVLVEHAVFSPDSRWLATVGGDAGIRVWETSHWQKVRTFRGHTDRIVAIDFSPDGHFLSTGARNGEVKLWRVDEPPAASGPVSFPRAEFFSLADDGSGFGRVLRLPDDTWAAEVWTAAPLQRVINVPLAGAPSSGVVLAGSRTGILGWGDGSIRIIGPVGGSEVVLTHPHQREIYLMDASLDGSTLATKELDYSDGAKVRIWRLPGLEPITELHHAQHVHGIKLSDNGKFLAGFTGPGDVGVWEIPSMKGLPMWRGFVAQNPVTACAFSPDNRWLAAATYDGSAYLWELATRRRTVLPRALTQYHSLSFSLDGSRLAAGSEGESRLFDVATGQAVLSFKQRGLKLAFARDSERLLAVHSEGASVLRAPRLENLQFDWLKEGPSVEPPPFHGPNPNYVRPDRPAGKD